MEINIQSAADELLGLDIEPYWYGFQKVAYAIYNSSEVFLFHHPKFQNQTFHKLGWDRTFAGNTVIMYEHYPTAIVNIEGIKDMASIKSFLVHELFHGFQYLREEKRFPDELLGVTYPLLEENVELRSRERQCLFDALEARDLQERESHFVQIYSTSGYEKRVAGSFFYIRDKGRDHRGACILCGAEGKCRRVTSFMGIIIGSIWTKINSFRSRFASLKKKLLLLGLVDMLVAR
ncbi:hypothetical protein [Paenibacillus sp. 453mf]|uniref:hypothetical protein n=1 Tax=Paenibacillus sp. 453mf TaxID=1761874 RepID=UPI0008E6FC91|nr:hypothetical protein [Paenibacillus sp. 453mf]SFS61044.1 hypothetical protein SAMN04488601_1012550 [Paenibacillus sp. 453mf]